MVSCYMALSVLNYKMSFFLPISEVSRSPPAILGARIIVAEVKNYVGVPGNNRLRNRSKKLDNIDFDC